MLFCWGNSTISTGPFFIANCNKLPEGIPSYIPLNPIKSPFLMGKSTISMAYVSLPEAILNDHLPESFAGARLGTRPGKHTKNYRKSPFWIGKSTISMGYFQYMLNYQRVSVLAMKHIFQNTIWWPQNLHLLLQIDVFISYLSVLKYRYNIPLLIIYI